MSMYTMVRLLQLKGDYLLSNHNPSHLISCLYEREVCIHLSHLFSFSRCNSGLHRWKEPLEGQVAGLDR